LVRGLREDEARAIAEAVCRHGAFVTPLELFRHSAVRAAALRRLATADAFRSMGLDRQHALWEIRAMKDEELPLFDTLVNEAGDAVHAGGAGAGPNRRAKADAAAEEIALPRVSEVQKVLDDYQAAGLSLKDHPMKFLRERLRLRGIAPAAQLKRENLRPHGSRMAVAGVVLVRQRPSTAKGLLFMTIEDETGTANLIVRPQEYERFRQAARDATVIVAHGRVERQGAVVHILVRQLADITHELQGLPASSRDFH
jgi:error-prone DNA polymerase